MTLFEATLLLFLFQGITLPFIVVIVYFICMRQWRWLRALPGQARAGKARAVVAENMRALPTFKPLNCPQCGAGLLLESDEVRCSHCPHREALPADYQRAAVLKTHLRRLLLSAQWSWRLAWLLTSRVVQWPLMALIYIEPFVLVPILLLGTAQYPQTHIGRWLGPYPGTGLGDFVPAVAIMGGVGWWVGYALLIDLSKSMRKKLPVFPVLSPEVQGRETASCQTCGGAIEYDRGDFATICSYCHVENYRVQFTRTTRHQAEQQQSAAKFLLFDALNIVNEFLFTIWILGAMILVAALLVWFKTEVWDRLGRG